MLVSSLRNLKSETHLEDPVAVEHRATTGIVGMCYGLNSFSSKSFVEVPIPNICECNLIWKLGSSYIYVIKSRRSDTELG